ncbi:MAG: DUF411 domain-containing protein [Stagnimonas sp.]|nr:DUF411 domain-containing protein [Stagnimonas sp.]
MPSGQGLPTRQLRVAAFVALPFGALAAILMSWDRLFPTPPEKLVQVAWRHDCACVQGWKHRLEDEGFVVRDFELEDLSGARRQWHVPDTAKGCHPATYMGYFLEGHISPELLHKLAREHPSGIGIQQVDTVKPNSEGKSEIVSSQTLLVSGDGSSRVWP